MDKSKCLRYRDVWVAPGTDMYEILTGGNALDRKVRAEKHYQQLEQNNRELEKRYGRPASAKQAVVPAGPDAVAS